MLQGVNERANAADLEDRADLQVVLQVLADALQVHQRRDAERLQPRAFANSGELQKLGRIPVGDFCPTRLRRLSAALGCERL